MAFPITQSARTIGPETFGRGEERVLCIPFSDARTCRMELKQVAALLPSLDVQATLFYTAARVNDLCMSKFTSNAPQARSRPESCPALTRNEAELMSAARIRTPSLLLQCTYRWIGTDHGLTCHRQHTVVQERHPTRADALAYIQHA